jgi:hypothetical protein
MRRAPNARAAAVCPLLPPSHVPTTITPWFLMLLAATLRNLLALGACVCRRAPRNRQSKARRRSSRPNDIVADTVALDGWRAGRALA